MTPLDLLWYTYSSSIDNLKLVYITNVSIILQGIGSFDLSYLTFEHILHAPKLMLVYYLLVNWLI